jgi:heparosan-N-sulfate-glucuronate 5-epimerase
VSLPLRRHLDSAFSRGVGYESTPPGRFIDERAVRGYFIDFGSKTTTPEALAPETLWPADLAQLALGWWERVLAGEQSAMQQFDRVSLLLERQAEVRGDERWWPYPVGGHKYGTEPPTYSAMAQAQAASVFVRAYLAGGDERHAELARSAVRPLAVDSGSGLVVSTPDGPVLEEGVSSPPSHILNGWIYSLWGLWDLAVGLGDEDARALYGASLSCLRRKLHEYDVGWWTRYSLYPHRLADLAKPFYHRLHIDQAEVLFRLTGHEEFRAAAQRWRSYDTPLHRVASIAQKALFVATRYA